MFDDKNSARFVRLIRRGETLTEEISRTLTRRREQ